MIGPLRALRRPVQQQRETIEFILPGGQTVALLRVRDTRARRMRLSVGERGARLTLPTRTSDAAAQRFVLEHADWLAAQLTRTRTTVEPLVPHGTTWLPLRNAAHAVHWSVGRIARVQLDGEAIAITAPAEGGEAATRRALRDFYEAQARTDVARWLPRYLPGLPRAPSRLRFRSMSSLWGSMTRDGAMSLDLSLVLARPEAFEYVLVHELCHLLHMDHSRAFWDEVEARCPDWRTQRAYFKGEGSTVKATLRALCG